VAGSGESRGGVVRACGGVAGRRGGRQPKGSRLGFRESGGGRASGGLTHASEKKMTHF
jgi:hypothetical protein